MRCFFLFLFFCLILLAISFCDVRAAVPERCQQFKPLFKKLEQSYDVTATLIAAQVTQESACKPRARSPWAQGLAQFTAATASDMRRWYPALLANFDVWHPEQASLALVLYMRRLQHMFRDAKTACDRIAFALSGYNSGPGWTIRDKRICARVVDCDSKRWWKHVEYHHDSRRRNSAIKESTEYPRRILKRWEPDYVHSWGGKLTCP